MCLISFGSLRKLALIAALALFTCSSAGFAAAVVEIILKDDLFGFGSEPLTSAIACPQVGRQREGAEAAIRLNRNALARAVMKHKDIAVRDG